MPDPDFHRTPGDRVDGDDHDGQPPIESVPHSSSSHWEWRPEYEVHPSKPDDPVSPRR